MKAHVITIKYGVVTKMTTFGDNNGFVSDIAVNYEFMSQFSKAVPDWGSYSDEAIQDFYAKGYAPAGHNSSVQIYRDNS